MKFRIAVLAAVLALTGPGLAITSTATPAAAASCSSATWLLKLNLGAGPGPNGGIFAGFDISDGAKIELNGANREFCKIADGKSSFGGFQMYEFVVGGTPGGFCVTLSGTNPTTGNPLDLEKCDSANLYQRFYFVGTGLYTEGTFGLGCMTADSQTPSNSNLIDLGSPVYFGGSFQHNQCYDVPQSGSNAGYQTMFSTFHP